MRIAVIGGGPKSLFALLALNDLLAATSTTHVAVDVYDPQLPGAGSVWRTDQPDTLRLNVQAGIVDASSSLSPETFADWLRRTMPTLAAEKYPPRATVGAYLREQFQHLHSHGHLAVTHMPHAVTGVERHDAKWRIRGDFPAQDYDEVLLATGHGLATAPRTASLPGAVNSTPLIGDYASITQESVPPGADVWVRGAALTAYDVALLLTEGRGGAWDVEERDDDGGARPTSLRYVPSGAEPGRITLFSRGGVLMAPKSEAVPDSVKATVAMYKILLRQWGSHVRDSPGGPAVDLAGMWAVLLHCAQECARAVGSDFGGLKLWRTALTGQSHSGSAGRDSSPDAAAELEHAIAVNNGRVPVTSGWVWGQVWSGLYPELIIALDRSPKDVRNVATFTQVAGHLEKFAFGPPELTAQKLVALFKNGILHLAAPHATPTEGAVVVDAVTPAPGVLHSQAPDGLPATEMYAGILDSGYGSVRLGERGLLTDLDGTLLGSAGARTESLAALGRPTEGPTLGHDTLNRALHPDFQRWAQRVATRAMPAGESSSLAAPRRRTDDSSNVTLRK
ncbi:MAG: FAD/NAD(P)-binding protein [Acidobacteria bacterium]|nr:FAD/NAD(P)-binding protein [Acidobacteriota bacterium]